MAPLDALRGVGVLAGTVGALTTGTLSYLLRRPLPQVEGELHLRGLNGSVEVIRDRWGIPHIFAADEHDATFGLGFCHAQDRLWQMDLNRRLARGQVAELVGPEALDLDRFLRRVGLHRAAQAEWATAGFAARQWVQAYAAGVNAAIEAIRLGGKLPLEFALTRTEPRPWEPLDSLAFGRYMAFTQAPNWETELIRARLIARLGLERAAALEPDVWQPRSGALPRLDDWGPAQMPPTPDEPGLALEGGQAGSNGWVVSGARSATGKPLLANDPHLFPRLPSIFYEAHLVGGAELNVAGASLPGVPGIIIGHNRHIAWGLTSSLADVQDFFVERIHPQEPTLVEFQGRWEAGSLVREVIPVKGRASPHVEEVLLTPRHGPLVAPTPLLADEHRTLALKSMVLDAPETTRSLRALNRASGWQEFREALRSWGTPSQNIVYADTEGNIGYQMSGLVPVRARGEGLVPSPGWTGQYEWTGTVAYEEMPSALNPPEGLWATANQQPSQGWSAFFGREFNGPARYRRIREVLASKERHSAVDFGALQGDLLSPAGLEVARLLGQRLRPGSPMEVEALQMLGAWDGVVAADSCAAAVYEVFRDELLRARCGDEAGDLAAGLLGVGPHPVVGPVTSFYFSRTEHALRLLREWAESDLPPSADDPVHRAFSTAVRQLAREQGGDARRWEWGRQHLLRLRHALSAQRPLGVLFDVPAFGVGGDTETVRQVGPLPGRHEAGGPTAGYRLIADCGDWDATLSCLPGGQSGHRGSAHYSDQVQDWRRVAYHPLAYSRPAVARAARHTLRLVPV